MQEIKEIRYPTLSTLSPEWELFRIVQPMTWTQLSQEPEALLMDMYRSIECGLNLQMALTSPKLKNLSDKYGKDTVCRLIGLVLRVYTNRFPAKSDGVWGAWRLREMAEWLFETYPQESLRDIMYAFRRVKHHYVSDLTVIMNGYLDWRAAKLEALYLTKTREEANAWPDEFKEKLPERWFLGSQTQPHGKNSKQNAA
ncbi:MAG: hypothetical protein KKG00_14175 [Bacteroidetes bacterium]|nr:hypothetical protein [Bacteroidota bacterium]